MLFGPIFFGGGTKKLLVVELYKSRILEIDAIKIKSHCDTVM